MKPFLNSIIICLFLTSIMSCQPEISLIEKERAEPLKFQVINNRVVFRDNVSFNETRDKLIRLNNKDLLEWEKKNNFTSLRYMYSVNRTEQATELVESFGFPMGLTSYINVKGEFQIGDRIFWYHDGLKHEVLSEQELASIKLNPSSSKVKSYAGIQKTVSSDSVQPLWVHSVNKDTPADARYNATLDIVGTAEQRRYLYQTYVYAEKYVNSNYNVKEFFTALVLNMRLDYYAHRDWPFSGYTWKPSADARHIELDLTISASTHVEDYAPDVTGYPSSQFFSNMSYQATTDVNDAQWYTLAAATIYGNSQGGNADINPSAVYWSYNIAGRITQSKIGHVTTSGQPAEYTVNGYPLW